MTVADETLLAGEWNRLVGLGTRECSSSVGTYAGTGTRRSDVNDVDPCSNRPSADRLGELRDADDCLCGVNGEASP